MWMLAMQRSLRKAWNEREVDGLRDHFEALPFETGIAELRASGRLGLSIAVLKRVWCAEADPPRCERCVMEWDAMIEDRPLRAPLVVVAFDVVEDEHGRRVVAHRACVGGCGHTSAAARPLSIDELLSWAIEARGRSARPQ